MAIPPEFAFVNEADFTSRLLIALLHRLGFSLVADYHGTREFGRDLVFGEIDRFGHVCYHGLQATSVGNIGQNDIQGLIVDCQQAFANPFRQPHTGAAEWINTFYAVNGGSISEQARDHFFNSLAHPYGGGIRLIDGKGLLALDRWAATNRSQTILPHLNGLLMEFGYNSFLATRIAAVFGEYAQQHGLGTNVSKPNPVPPQRFRLNATNRYLERPFCVEAITVLEVQAYWERTSLCNALMDKVIGLTTVNVVDDVVKTIMQIIPEMGSLARRLEEEIRSVLQSLGPLTGV
jgi:hypothetical protein